MEARRLVTERLERFREVRVLEKLCDSIGNRRDEVEVGKRFEDNLTSMPQVY